jgi:hypothetical protein
MPRWRNLVGLGRVARVALTVLLTAAALLTIAPAASAATCRTLGAYTDYYYSPQHFPPNQPSLYIWNGAVRPDPGRLTVLYYGSLGWEVVPTPSNDGVRTDAPQAENRNGWYIYFIATRWYLTHPLWNDDGRWRVVTCS